MSVLDILVDGQSQATLHGGLETLRDVSTLCHGDGGFADQRVVPRSLVDVDPGLVQERNVERYAVVGDEQLLGLEYVLDGVGDPTVHRTDKPGGSGFVAVKLEDGQSIPPGTEARGLGVEPNNGIGPKTPSDLCRIENDRVALHHVSKGAGFVELVGTDD